MSDPQARAESLDEDEQPPVDPPDEFIEPEDWDAGAGGDEREAGSDRESPLNAEDAAMHVEPGNATEGEDAGD